MNSDDVGSDDDLFFDDSNDSDASRASLDRWKILVVDDEPEVFQVTALALQDFAFSDRGLELIPAYSGAEAQELINKHNDIALILLDVVMESEHAGLKLVRWIREEKGNSFVRIILRTGQPGQAPEKKVISEYDINDYKEKTELTATKLFTVVTSGLRSYRDMMALEESRVGLERVIDASANIMKTRSLESFTAGALSQLTALFYLPPNAVYGTADGLAATKDDISTRIVAGIGRYADSSGESLNSVLPSSIIDDWLNDRVGEGIVYLEEGLLALFASSTGEKNLLFISGQRKPSPHGQRLIELFARNISIAFHNLYLNKEVEGTQLEISSLLASVVETRSQETAMHVRRVSEISQLLARAYGLGDDDVALIKFASPLHDLGKIAVPDAILNKDGTYEPDEWAVMQDHAQIGYDMLKESERSIIKSAAVIAQQHHEKWDGTGYPMGLKGEEIHILGRITAVADVYDALRAKRCYKDAWNLESTVQFFKEERNKQFDGRLVDILLDKIDEIETIRSKYSDESTG